MPELSLSTSIPQILKRKKCCFTQQEHESFVIHNIKHSTFRYLSAQIKTHETLHFLKTHSPYFGFENIFELPLYQKYNQFLSIISEYFTQKFFLIRSISNECSNPSKYKCLSHSSIREYNTVICFVLLHGLQFRRPLRQNCC
jgi:hypothetical protein